jgi:hypothetical protein
MDGGELFQLEKSSKSPTANINKDVFSHHCFSTSFLANEIRREKEIKLLQIGKEEIKFFVSMEKSKELITKSTTKLLVLMSNHNRVVR